MATAKKLPSGSWRCLVYSHTEVITNPDGSQKKKKIYKSFTCDDPSPKGKRQAEKEAAAWAVDKERGRKPEKITFGQAVDNYIKGRENVLSPRTIMDYKATRKNYVQGLMGRRVDRITPNDIQIAINIEAAKLSPKSIRNVHGLISAVMKMYRPELALNTSLPKMTKPDLYIPTDQEIKTLIDAVSGTEMELPVLLAAFGPMRRGEICALESEDIQGNIVHVHRNMVKNGNGGWIVKTPKSIAGDRYIDYPDFIREKWEGISGRIVPLRPDKITDDFSAILKKAGLPHFRFHDLRHYSASIQHALGIPDSYIMRRGGWENDTTLKAVYRHTLSDREQLMNQVANMHFSELYNTKCNTNEKKP